MNLAYVAGLMDGEGSIGFTRSRSWIVPRVSIVNTDLELLTDIRDHFGGWVHPLWRQKAAWKCGYSWTIANKPAVRFVEKLQPWLRLKYDQCLLLYAWEAIAPGGGKPLTPETIETAALLKEQAHWLNWRGAGRPAQSPMDLECNR